MPHDIDLSPLASTGLDLDQYFGLWAVDDSLFLAQLERIGQMNLLAHVEIHQSGQSGDSRAAASFEGHGPDPRIAKIQIQGTMTKRGSSFSDAGSMIALRQTIRAAARDDEISGILLVIDSPGGTVAGTADLAREVYKARQSKPVYAYVEDMAASAAYWVASQADRVYANDATALVGSIGTFVGLYDYSEQAAKKGIRPVVIKAGTYKGAGFPGAEITDEQKAIWQEIVDATQAEFTQGFARGRKLSIQSAEALVQGRVWMASDAKDLKLIDGIQTYQDTVSEIVDRSRKARKRTMAEDSKTTETGPVMASYKDLKAALPGADNDFLASQLEAEATLPQATTAWMAEQGKRLEAANAATVKAEKLEAAAIKDKEAANGKAGLDVAGEGGTAGEGGHAGDPTAEWKEKVAAKVSAGMSRMAASSAVNRENPELREAFVQAANV
jgi:protease-4